MKHISIVVPCYNEEEALPLYYEAMLPVLETLRAQGAESVFELNPGGHFQEPEARTARGLAWLTREDGRT